MGARKPVPPQVFVSLGHKHGAHAWERGICLGKNREGRGERKGMGRGGGRGRTTGRREGRRGEKSLLASGKQRQGRSLREQSRAEKVQEDGAGEAEGVPGDKEGSKGDLSPRSLS